MEPHDGSTLPVFVASLFLVLIQLGVRKEWKVLSTTKFHLLVTCISKSQAVHPFMA